MLVRFLELPESLKSKWINLIPKHPPSIILICSLCTGRDQEYEHIILLCLNQLSGLCEYTQLCLFSHNSKEYKNLIENLLKQLIF